MLTYLEGKLRLIQTVGAAKDRIRFALDPLAEYLAGIHVVETHGPDEAAWKGFLNDDDAKPGRRRPSKASSWPCGIVCWPRKRPFPR